MVARQQADGPGRRADAKPEPAPRPLPPEVEIPGKVPLDPTVVDAAARPGFAESREPAAAEPEPEGEWALQPLARQVVASLPYHPTHTPPSRWQGLR